MNVVTYSVHLIVFLIDLWQWRWANIYKFQILSIRFLVIFCRSCIAILAGFWSSTCPQIWLHYIGLPFVSFFITLNNAKSLTPGRLLEMIDTSHLAASYKLLYTVLG